MALLKKNFFKMNYLDIDITKYKTLFLDRDGVINTPPQNVYLRSWEEFVFMPNILEALKKWNAYFERIVVVTNQRGVGLGLMSEQDLAEIHQKMVQEIERNGGRIDKIFYSTATENSDENRKPNIGMFHQARQCFPDIEIETSLMIGDSDKDIEFADKVGMDSIKV